MNSRIVGIMGAMPEEINGVIQLLAERKEIVIGARSYYTGYINKTKVVVVFSKWGKVAAAITATTLILEFGITELIFTGVAGAIHDTLKIGDIVLAYRTVQHDMDSRPLLPQYELPLIRKVFLETPPRQLDMANRTISSLLKPEIFHYLFKDEDLDMFNISIPACHVGDIASGDQFFSSNKQKEALKQSLPSVLCVEMEGAAVAQVCYEYNIPWLIIRTISDASDDNSPVDFQLFIKKIASKYSKEIIQGYL